MADLRVDIVSDFVGKKAFDKAGKSVSALDKAVNKLGKQLGSLFALSQITKFGKASAQAFLDAEKANTRLTQVVDNLGLSFATAGIQKNLDEISASAGIAGEILVDAFQPLLTATGSVIKSQELLKQALDISAGSGVDLATVANDLSQAFVGNTRGLRKYNLGLTQAELQGASFVDVQERLTELFSGSNAKYLTTYAGQMQVLTEAAGNAQEIIGGGLIDSLIALNGDTTVEDLATDMQNFATYTANTVRGLGLMIKELNKIPGAGSFGDFLKTLIKAQPTSLLIGALQGKGAEKQSTGFSFFGSPMEETQKKRNAAAAAKAEKDAAKRAKAIIDSQKKNTAELKKQALAKKQSALFDMEQIQIMAALKGNISKEERLRLELQLALITGNTTEADKLSQKLAYSIDQTGNLAKYLTTLPDANNPFKSWDAFLDSMIAKARAAAAAVGSVGGGGAGAVLPSTNAPMDDSGFRLPDTMPGQSGSGAQFGSNTPWAQAANISIQIDKKEIANAMLDLSMSAGQVTYLDRRTGGF